MDFFHNMEEILPTQDLGRDKRGDKMGTRRKADKTNPYLRAAFLEVVDNQLRENNPPKTKETLERLISEGYSAEKAKELIAQAVVVEAYVVMKTQTTFNRERFIRNLRALPQEPKE